MPEASRFNAAGVDVRYPTGTLEPNDLPDERLDLPELPETASPANNPALNRSAAVLGRSVGTAVAGVKSLPRQFDRLRSCIHLVKGGRSATAYDVRESLAKKVQQWRDEAETGIGELKDKAEVYTYDAADRTNRRLEDLRRRTGQRLQFLRHDARRWLAQARRWQTEEPLKVIGACAAGAFALGIALRVWRSRSE